MKLLSRFFSAILLTFCLGNTGHSSQVPSDWVIMDQSKPKMFVKLLRDKNKFLCEKNYSSYLNMYPKFLAEKIRNQQKSVQYSDQKMSDVLAMNALTEESISNLRILGLKQSGMTTAILMRGKTDSNKKFHYLLQSFYREGSDWKVGETISFHKTKDESIDSELQQVNFRSTLPEIPTSLPQAELKGLYSIGPMSNGLEAEWKLNGILQTAIETSGSGIIIGGLKNGLNQLEIRVIGNVTPVFPIKVKIYREPHGTEDYQKIVPYLDWTITATGAFKKDFDVAIN